MNKNKIFKSITISITGALITICSNNFAMKRSHPKRPQEPCKIRKIEKTDFRCSFCGKEFYYRSQREQHVRIHTGEKPFKCSYCDKSFARKSTLTQHFKVHTNEKPFKCSYCDKSFAQKWTLRCHLRTHTNENLFKCNICQKHFTYKESLTRHIRIHTGEKNFGCSYCNKCFSRKDALKRHIRSLHRDITCQYHCNNSLFQKEAIIRKIKTEKDKNSRLTKTDDIQEAAKILTMLKNQ